MAIMKFPGGNTLDIHGNQTVNARGETVTFSDDAMALLRYMEECTAKGDVGLAEFVYMYPDEAGFPPSAHAEIAACFVKPDPYAHDELDDMSDEEIEEYFSHSPATKA